MCKSGVRAIIHHQPARRGCLRFPYREGPRPTNRQGEPLTENHPTRIFDEGLELRAIARVRNSGHG
jgi:hypothetical protein